MRYALVGHGRMGRAIEGQAASRGHERVAALTASDSPITAARLAGAEIAFEFSVPEAAERNVSALLDCGVPVVCGTTGWDADAVRARSRRSGTALIVAPNFSIGVNVFFRAVHETARLLGATGRYQAHVHEAHHRGKRDAPSGTARRLAALLLAADRRLAPPPGGDPAEAGTAVPVTSTRCGHEPGLHQVGFDSAHDVITLEHRARGREGFAEGAVIAAEWLLGQRGPHTFDEVLDHLLGGEAPPAGRSGREHR